MHLPEAVTKYLRKYTTESRIIEWNPFKVHTAIVIPAIQEYENIKGLLASLNELHGQYLDTTLFLFVINNTLSAEHSIKEENLKTLLFLRGLIKEERKLHIGVIDASTEGKELSDKEGGVGLARKIGMDESLRIFDYSDNKPKLLICLDADCAVKADYLENIHRHFYRDNCDAASIYFEHSPEPLTDAIIVYEIFLRYYVRGLRFANSPYAFHTVGSAMASTYQSYIKIEGMNKKKAAEDFYFLEKLAKNASVSIINDTAVFPSQRGSWRVPFGTGQRVNRYHAKTHDEYLLYNPEIFSVLKQWIGLLNNQNNPEPKELLQSAKDICPFLYSFLVQNNFENDWLNILKSSRSALQVEKQKHKWFDGFRTLKLVHYLRDNGFPNTDMFAALNRLFDMTGTVINFRTEEKIPSYETRMLYLKTLRDLDRNTYL